MIVEVGGKAGNTGPNGGRKDVDNKGRKVCRREEGGKEETQEREDVTVGKRK